MNGHFGGRQFAALAVFVLSVAVVFSVVFWDWLSAGDSGSTTIRNIGLVIGGVLAILLAIWRSIVAERSLLNERYQKGAEMLGSDVLSVRLGGIYALQRLAEDNPKAYHIHIMQLFCAFVRGPTGKPESYYDPATDYESPRTEPPAPPREDVQAVLTAIGGRSRAGLACEVASNFGLELDGADLSGVHLRRANLSGANLRGVYFAYARLFGVDMSGVDMALANLSDTDFSGRGQDPAIGLTQSRLDEARADEGSAPDLEGVVDATTGKPLVWRGGSR